MNTFCVCISFCHELIIFVFFTFILIFLIIYNQILYILEQRRLAYGRNVKITFDVIMSPKLFKYQNFKKNFKDALFKYIVVKFHNFTWSINQTASNWKWGRWKLGWVYITQALLKKVVNVHKFVFEQTKLNYEIYTLKF